MDQHQQRARLQHRPLGLPERCPPQFNYTFPFPRTPSSPTSKTTVQLGPCGVWRDGLIIYGPWDGLYYTSSAGYTGVWQRNAYFWEGYSFDKCLGHPDVYGIYHNHVNPTCMYTSSSTSHSPLLGFMLDGYPIYGTYGYSSANSSSSSIKRMTSSYATRSITSRTTLSNGTTLSSNYYGPTINSTYPLGYYLQDYVYTSGYGDLDEHNGTEFSFSH